VVALSSDRSSFEFRLASSGRVVSGKFESDEFVPDLRSYLDFFNMAPSVCLTCVVLRSRDETVVEIENALAVEQMLPEVLAERILELSQLEAGWLERSGQQLSRVTLREAETLLLEFLDEGIAQPNIYPMPSGGVQSRS
jgi:hypothetical protein